MNRKKRKPAAVLSTGPTRPWLTRPDGGAPGFVLLIALYAVIGPNILLAMAVFGVLIAPSFFRLVRSLVQGIRHELYVDAARVAGLSDRRIISRHVLRAVRGPIIVHASFVAYLFITHDLGVVRALRHRIAVMLHGEIVELGSAAQVSDQPQHPYTQRLQTAAPIADPVLQEQRRQERHELLARLEREHLLEQASA